MRRAARSAGRGAVAVGRAGAGAAKRAAQTRGALTGIVAAGATGAVAGYVAADRGLAGKPTGFKIGSHEIQVGDIAAIGGAALVLSSNSESTRRLGSYVAAGGAALRGSSIGYEYRMNRDKK